MPQKPDISILIVHDQRAGHLNPCLGICETLGESYHVSTHEYISKPLNKKTISVLKKSTWYPTIFKFLFRIIICADQELTNKFNCIICSGMQNLLYSIYLSHNLKLPLFYLGDTRNINDSLITATITALPQNIKCSQIILPTPPVKKAYLNMKADQLDGKTALLVLGGPTHEHPFSKEDFITIINSFTAFCKKNNLSGIITNSRRTPKHSDLINLKLPSFIEFHNIHDKNSKTIIENFKSSTYIFVTEESTSMLAEAIQSGRYISSLYSDKSQLSPLNKKYIEQKMMHRQYINHEFMLSHIRNLDIISISRTVNDMFTQILGGSK